MNKKLDTFAVKQTVYVVIGETGEYEDRRQWNVCALKSKDEADRYARLASNEAGRIELEKQEIYEETRLPENCNPENKYDPGMSMDYTGTTYRVEPLSLEKLSKKLIK